MNSGGGHAERREEQRAPVARRSSKLGPDPALSDAASLVMILAENIISALKD